MHTFNPPPSSFHPPLSEALLITKHTLIRTPYVYGRELASCIAIKYRAHAPNNGRQRPGAGDDGDIRAYACEYDKNP